MRNADLSLTVSQRKPACVLDPLLVLGHSEGPALALRLARVFEPWLTRSFWQALDSSDWLLRRQARLAAAGELAAARAIDAQALARWSLLRERTDAGHWTLRWVGDSLAESQIGSDNDEDLVDRYEGLAAGLLARLPDEDDGDRWRHGLDPVAASIDALVLSAALDGAIVISPRAGDGGVPAAVQAASRVGLTIGGGEGPLPDSLFDDERRLVRDALAQAGLAPLLARLAQPPLAWQLIVVHVHVQAPVAAAPAVGIDAALAESLLDVPDPWADAQGWWYPL